MIEDLDRGLEADKSNVRLLYSNALSRVELTPDRISTEDGLHLSPAGYEAVAEAAMADLNQRKVFATLAR